MKQSKTTRKTSNGQYKYRANNWKKKAIFRREENEKLKKRIKELTYSRDSWKEKHKLEKNRTQSCSILEGEKAERHHYSIALTSLVIELYKYGGMSLRSCRHCLSCMFICLGMHGQIPSHSSIRNWICKCGIYRVRMRPASSEGQVIFVDESITFGSEKILLILGVCESKIKTKKALTHEDMCVLYVCAGKEWKGERIKEEIEKIAQREKIKYVVSDQGTNLRKAYKLLNYNHIEDCTHVLANCLKSIYEKDEDFETFRKLIGKLRQSWNLSKQKSQYMPPTMRGKMRFANIFPCVSWARRMLRDWATLSEEVQLKLSFIKENPEFISSLFEVEEIFKFVCAKLKNEGFGLSQKQEILDMFSNGTWGEKSSVFVENCKDYLTNLTQKKELLGEEHLLCSSDIIESYFGKFKAKVNPNNRSGLTEFIFTIATFGQAFSQEEVKNAMQNIKIKDFKLYNKKAEAT